MTCDPLRCEVRISASIVRCSSVNDSSQTSSSSSSSSSVSLSTLSSSHALRHSLILHLLLSPQPHLPLPSLQHPFLCPIPPSICRPSSIKFLNAHRPSISLPLPHEIRWDEIERGEKCICFSWSSLDLNSLSDLFDAADHRINDGSRGSHYNYSRRKNND